MILIKNGEVYAPRSLGRCDLLTGGNEILALEQGLDAGRLPGEVTVIEADGMVVVPGFVDGHQHFTGGGGEGGFHTRTPEMTLSMNIKNGITTAVGLLGTDSLTRSVESLYAKTEAFNAEGMTAYMLTGSYWLPSPTICGSVARDLTYMRPVIGVKLALADVRGPHLDVKDLSILASDVRVAALVADKPGVITVHTGAGPEGLGLIFDAIRQHAIRPDLFIPTHINRKDPKIREQALALAQKGAVIDATCLEHPPDEASPHLSAADLACFADENSLFDQVSFSSDAGGSLPKWSPDRSRILGMGIGSPASMRTELHRLVAQKGMPLEKALRPLTTTPACIYGLKGSKGVLTPGAHADLLVLDPDNLEIRDVVARGQIMMRNQILERKGYFE